MNEIVTVEAKQIMSAAEVRDQINKVQSIMKAVMKPDTHYGVIPGTKKPTLYKAGSEVLLTTFHIGLQLKVEDLSDKDSIRYRVKAVGFHQPTGQIIGEGVGECSTNEEKYKWRTAICDEEFEYFPESRRRVKFSRIYNKYQKRYEFIKTNQVRTEPADLANTVLKMAKKRAQIDFTLTALGTSDIFTQDIEDLPDELRETMATSEDGTPLPQGEPIEHPAMKEAKDIQALAAIMNSLKSDERKKFMPYFNKRKEELSGGNHE